MTVDAAGLTRFDHPNLQANYERACRRYPAQAIVDLAALRDNMRHLVEIVNADPAKPHRTEVMGVVKADAYGHGLVPAALAALAGGATWLGTAQAHEALELRRAGIGPERARILTWVNDPYEVPYDELLRQHIDVSVGTPDAVEQLAKAAEAVQRFVRGADPIVAHVHVKVDTGFGRNGFTLNQLDLIAPRLKQLQDAGLFEITGQWSHLAVADAPDVPEFVHETDEQVARFEEFTRHMQEAGIEPRIRHLANTAATLSRPEIHYDLVRPGVALYGYEPDPAMGTPQDYGLTPAMTLQAQLSSVKHVPQGTGLSYGRVYVTDAPTSVAIVPVGYADGIHRSASGFDRCGSRHEDRKGGPVAFMTRDGVQVRHVSGRVCMDQFIVDLHGDAKELGIDIGDTVQLFGPGRGEAYGEPTADDWAKAADTISYEIFTCLRNRVPRLYRNAASVLDADDLAMLDQNALI
ncbi:alanine racemase [Bifidobacterium gallicum]